MADTLIHHSGGAVKAMPGGMIEGYLVSWGNPQDADLQGEFFTQKTEFCLDWFTERPVLYHHGMNEGPALKSIGTIKAIRQDDLGLWVQAELNLADKYAAAVYDMVKSKQFGWSSGSVDHLVKTADSGEIVVWPLIEGSVTPTPAQPSKTTVRALKALFANEDDFLKGLDERVEKGSMKMAPNLSLKYAKAAANALGLKLNGDELNAIAAEMEEDPSIMGDEMLDDATLADDDLSMMADDDELFGGMAADDDEFGGMMADDEFDAYAADDDLDAYAAEDDFEAYAADDELPATTASVGKKKSRKASARKGAKPRQKAALSFEPNMGGMIDPGVRRYIQRQEKMLQESRKRIKALEEMEAPGQRAFKAMSIKDEADIPGAYKAVFEGYLRFGDGTLSESQKYVLNGKGKQHWRGGGDLQAVKTAQGTWTIKTITSGSDASWGYGVPEDWVNELNKNIASATVMAPECRTRNTTSDRLVQPNLVTTDARRAHAARTKWVGEQPGATDHVGTEDTLSQIGIPVHVVMVSNPVSQTALEDMAFDIETELTEAYSEAVGVDYDTFIYAGDGNGKLEGVTVSAGVITAASSGVSSVGGYLPTGSTSGFLNADVVISTLYHLPAQYRTNAKWAMNSNTLREVSLLKDGNGNYLMGDRNEGLRGMSIPDQLLQRPILVNEFAPDIGSGTFPIVLGDWRRGYTVAKRVDFAVRRFDQDANFAQLDQVLFLGRARVGGQVTQPACFKVIKCATS